MTTSSSPPLTIKDYRSGSPRHNARVFIATWPYTIVGIDNDGLFGFHFDSNRAELLDFRELVAAIRNSDVHHQMTGRDVVDAAAMVFHLTPWNWLSNDRS